jgi:hypothetical protein
MTDSVLIAGPLMIAAVVMAVRFVGCGLDDSPLPGNGDENGNGDRDGKPPSGGTPGELNGFGRLTAKTAFPDFKPETQPYDGAGTYTYTIPYWCTTIDLVLLGAAGGGSYNEFSNGVGGGAGDWKTATLQRGSDIPWSATTITVTVGHGGAGGTLAAGQGAPGGDTTASWDTTSGPTTKTASGGGAGASTSGLTGDGPSPNSQTAGDASLTAGSAQATPGGPGNAPGGGGGGGDVISPGGAGADGVAIVVASQN